MTFGKNRGDDGTIRGLSLKILAIFLIVVFQVFSQCGNVRADTGVMSSPSETSPSSPAGPAAAAAQPDQGVAAWVVSLGKTATYRVAASLDALVVGYLYTGSLLGGGGIALFNAVVSSTLYDLHEMAWNDFGPDQNSVDKTQIAIIKTITYRVISIANVLLTGLLFTGNFWLSSGLALGNAVIDSTIYFFHELAWSYWGPTVKPDLSPKTNG